MELASFKRRVFVYLIDILIAIMIGVGASVPLFIFTSIPWLFTIFFMILFCYLAYILLNTFIIHISKGYTLGGLMLWIQTLNEDGNSLSMKKTIERNLYLGLIPFALIDVIDYLINQSKKLVLDRLTGTMEIDIKRSHFVS